MCVDKNNIRCQYEYYKNKLQCRCVTDGDTSYVGNKTVDSNETMLYDLSFNETFAVKNNTLSVNDELNTFDNSECLFLMLWAALGVIGVCLIICIIWCIVRKRRREKIGI